MRRQCEKKFGATLNRLTSLLPIEHLEFEISSRQEYGSRAVGTVLLLS